MSAVVSLSTERLRRQLQGSVDLLDLGETISNAGSAMNSAGRHVLMLNELPTPHMLDDIEFMGMAIIQMANELRLALAPPPDALRPR